MSTSKSARRIPVAGAASPAPEAVEPRWLCIAAMAVALVLFAGAIGAGFVWDDELLFRSWLPYVDGPASVL